MEKHRQPGVRKILSVLGPTARLNHISLRRPFRLSSTHTPWSWLGSWRLEVERATARTGSDVSCAAPAGLCLKRGRHESPPSRLRRAQNEKGMRSTRRRPMPRRRHGLWPVSRVRTDMRFIASGSLHRERVSEQPAEGRSSSPVGAGKPGETERSRVCPGRMLLPGGACVAFHSRCRSSLSPSSHSDRPGRGLADNRGPPRRPFRDHAGDHRPTGSPPLASPADRPGLVPARRQPRRPRCRADLPFRRGERRRSRRMNGAGSSSPRPGEALRNEPAAVSSHEKAPFRWERGFILCARQDSNLQPSDP